MESAGRPGTLTRSGLQSDDPAGLFQDSINWLSCNQLTKVTFLLDSSWPLWFSKGSLCMYFCSFWFYESSSVFLKSQNLQQVSICMSTVSNPWTFRANRIALGHLCSAKLTSRAYICTIIHISFVQENHVKSLTQVSTTLQSFFFLSTEGKDEDINRPRPSLQRPRPDAPRGERSTHPSSSPRAEKISWYPF